MSGKYGVQETLDVLELVKVAVGDVAKAFADGHIDLFDVPKFLNLIGPVNKALTGLMGVVNELKELDESEAAILWAKCVEIFASIPGGFKLPS